MPKLCINCSRADALKRLITDTGKLIRKCRICGAENIKALNCKNNILKQLFKSLIRYHFSEWDYNGKWGGESIESLFDQENPILNFSDSINGEKLEDAVLELIDKVYEGYERGVSLYAGYDENSQPLLLLEAIKTKFDSRLKSIEDELKDTNYFLLTNKGVSLVKDHVLTLESIIPSGSTYFRARIGYEKEGISTEGWIGKRLFQPYKDSNISAPSPLKATPGRMNRDGVSFLYLSTDLETAIAEVRPHPGQIVSIGKFVSNINLRIADFNSIDFINYSLSDKMLDVFLLLNSINTAFSLPVPPNHLHSYSLTQFLSDVMRLLNFDGIAFKSSVGTGTNLTIFDPNKFGYIVGSAKLVKTEMVTYSFMEIPNLEDSDEYIELKDGKPAF